jgi:hypothetical protein
MPLHLPSRALRSPLLAQRLNIAAVGLTIGAWAGVVLSAMLGGASSWKQSGIVCALTSLLYGLIWARIMRVPFRRPLGIALSLPLAAMNAGTALAVMAVADRENPVGMFFLGCTFGAIVWIPALLVTLFCFSLPLLNVQRAAVHGLSRVDRAERLLGCACAALSFGALIASAFATHGRVDVPFLQTLASASLVCGLTSALLSHTRERTRRAFLTAVANGTVAEYRIDDTYTAPVLVRVTPPDDAYRAIPFVEPLFVLDDNGDVKSRFGAR